MLLRQLLIPINAKILCIGIIIGGSTLLFSLGCNNNSRNRNKTKNNTSLENKTMILIGYGSLPIYLGSKKKDVEKAITLKWDKDNEIVDNSIGYYSPLQIVETGNIKANVNLYFTFLKQDSSLKRFEASIDFDNYYREKIIPGLPEYLNKIFPNMINFSIEEIRSGREQTSKHMGYDVKIKLDTASYSPTFYYKIESH